MKGKDDSCLEDYVLPESPKSKFELNNAGKVIRQIDEEKATSPIKTKMAFENDNDGIYDVDPAVIRTSAQKNCKTIVRHLHETHEK